MQHKSSESRVAAEERHQALLRLLRTQGYTTIDNLAAATGVTPQTIRRDLHHLGAAGLLRRHHGGASIASAAGASEYPLRLGENAAAKAAIGQAVLPLVPEGALIFMTIGTTVQAVAKALTARRELVVVTNDRGVADTLGPIAGMTVHSTAGRVNPVHGGLSGAAAADSAGRWRCDILVSGCGGITADGWLLDYHEEEVVVTQAMADNARRIIVVADHTKFSRITARKMLRLERVTTLVTDRKPPDEFAALAAKHDVEVVIAGDD